MNQSIYGSSLCPKCGKRHYAILASKEKFIPPPTITIGCQCQMPPVSVDLHYAGPIGRKEDR